MIDLKQQASEEAVRHVENGMTLGLGSGTTVRFVLEALARRIQAGELPDVVGVPTSKGTAAYAQELGIPLTTLNDAPVLDMAIDGADEVDPDLNLIKGLGGALVREKIVANAAHRLLIVVGPNKEVNRLGMHAPVPVEVLPFGWKSHLPFLDQIGAETHIRLTLQRDPCTTDNGNYVLDCLFHGGIDDPYTLAATLDSRPGVVGHGLFLDMTDMVFVGTNDGVRIIDGAVLA